MITSKTTSDLYDIAIIGAGFTGLTQALALSNSCESLKIIIIDHGTPTNISDRDNRAFAISAGSKQMLDLFNIWPAISSNAQPITKMEITDSKLENIVRPVLLEFENKLDNNQPSTYIVPSRDLTKALIDNVAQNNQISIMDQTELKSFSQKTGKIELTLEKGGARRQVHAKLLIASDGKRSQTRKLANIKTIGWSYDQLGIVCAIKHERPHNGVAVQHFLPDGPFARLPLPGNKSSIVWSENATKAQKTLSADEQYIFKEIERRFGRQLGTIEIEQPVRSFPLDLRIAREFVKDRVALIGDSAHGVHPIAGLGLNIGFRDIAALTEVIIQAHRLGLDFGTELTLQKYAQWRRFDTILSALTMDMLNRLFSNEVTPIRIVRDLGLGIVNRLPQLKKSFIQQAAGLSGEVPQLLKGEAL